MALILVLVCRSSKWAEIAALLSLMVMLETCVLALKVSASLVPSALRVKPLILVSLFKVAPKSAADTLAGMAIAPPVAAVVRLTVLIWLSVARLKALVTEST